MSLSSYFKKHLATSSIILLMIGLLVVLPLYSGANGFLHLRGRVIYNENPIPYANISVWEQDSVVYQMKTNFQGNFSLYVPFQKEFIFTFSDGNLISKKVFINTITPFEPDPEQYYTFRFEVGLFENGPEVYKEFYNFPVAIVFYDTQKADFNYYRANTSINTDMDIFASVGDITFESQEINTGRELLEQEILLPIADASERIHEFEPPSDSEPELLASASLTTPDDLQLSLIGENGSTSTDIIPQQSAISALPSADIQTSDSKVFGICETPFHEFFNYKNPGQEVDFKGQVFFSVQLLATAKSVPPGFFNKINQNLPSIEILKYTDVNDGLDKYIAGVYKNMDATLKQFRQLRSMGYDGYIVAFYNNQRVRVSIAQELQDE